MKSLLKDILCTKKDLHAEHSLMIQIEIQTMKTLVETMWCGLKTRLAEVKA
jgi:hypothetical protein